MSSTFTSAGLRRPARRLRNLPTMQTAALITLRSPQATVYEIVVPGVRWIR
jgi:hypothetical protein